MCEGHSDKLIWGTAARWGDKNHDTIHVNERQLNLIRVSAFNSGNEVVSTRVTSPNFFIVYNRNLYFVHGDYFDQQNDDGLWGCTDLGSDPLSPFTSEGTQERYLIF